MSSEAPAPVMAANLREFVYQLVPFYAKPNFDQHCEQQLSHLTVGEQYQVKSELVRICQPCEKVIDLRKLVADPCRKFVYGGRVHYLDEFAIGVFNEGLQWFGQYTMGLWEDVYRTGNNYRVQQARAEQERINLLKQEKQRKADKLQHILATQLSYSSENYPVHIIRFGDYLNRQEERMNYAVQATLNYADGRQIDAVTKDLSIQGLYVRVSMAETVAMDDRVQVVMSGQSEAYLAVAAKGIEYQVKRIEYRDQVLWLGLNRTFAEVKAQQAADSSGTKSSGNKSSGTKSHSIQLAELDNPSTTLIEDPFSVYLGDLIGTNKYVYKVNLDNAIDAALKQGHEQVFFSRTVTIPLFIESIGSQQRLRYVLTTGLNHNEYRYWDDDQGQSYLCNLFQPTRVKTLIDAQGDETLLLSFRHEIDGQILFFAVFIDQLSHDSELFRLFTGYAATKDSFKIFKIKRVSLNQQDSDRFFTVPIRLQGGQNADPSSEAVTRRSASAADDGDDPLSSSTTAIDLGNLTHGLLMTEVTDDAARQVFKDRGYDPQQMATMKEFQLHNLGVDDAKGMAVKCLHYGFDELRHEPRFSYKTRVVARFANGMSLECATTDFSARGLQLNLPRAMMVDKGDDIYLSFPLLQQITKQLILKNLAYQVVGVENHRKTLYLRAVTSEEALHHGVKFFYDLIKRNRDKLSLVTNSEQEAQLVKALKNRYQQALGGIPFYVNRVNGTLRLTKLVSSREPHPLLTALCSDDSLTQVNINVLINHRQFGDFISQAQQLITEINQKADIDLYIAIKDPVVSDPLRPGEGAADAVKGITADLATPVFPDQFTVASNKTLKSPTEQKKFVMAAQAGGQFYCIRVYLSLVAKVDTRKIAEELAYIHHYASHKSKTIAQLLTGINNVGEMVDITDYVLSYLDYVAE